MARGQRAYSSSPPAIIVSSSWPLRKVPSALITTLPRSDPRSVISTTDSPSMLGALRAAWSTIVCSARVSQTVIATPIAITAAPVMTRLRVPAGSAALVLILCSFASRSFSPDCRLCAHLRAAGCCLAPRHRPRPPGLLPAGVSRCPETGAPEVIDRLRLEEALSGLHGEACGQGCVACVWLASGRTALRRCSERFRRSSALRTRPQPGVSACRAALGSCPCVRRVPCRRARG